MRRLFLLTAAAVIILSLTLAVLAVLRSGTLAQKTVRVRGSSVVFRISEAEGRLYADAEEQRPWSNGWRVQVLIGEVTAVGRENPKIVSGEGGERVLLRVGKAAVEFDPASRSFHASDKAAGSGE